MDFDYDFVVIGAGSGGVRCSRVAASLGARVAIIENRYLGGTCVNVGCIPKKLCVYASEFSEQLDVSQQYGWQIGVEGFDWQTFKLAKDTEIQRLNGIYAGLLERAGVELIRGHGRFLDAHQIEVDGRIISAKTILIATGGWPRRGDYPGAQLCITSNDVFSLESLPKSVLIEGGGYIATEFASIFNGLGCQTELAYRGPLFLRGFDQEIRDFLAQQLRTKGICLNFNAEIAKVEETPSGKRKVTFEDGQQTEVDVVLSAIGRMASVADLGLENTSVTVNSHGYIDVDDQFKTQQDNIYAIGDVIGRVPLTPVAIKEGAALAQHLFAGVPVSVDYHNIPTAVFSQPEIATVGLTEELARSQFNDIEVFSSDFKPLKYTLTESKERTFMKLIIAGDTRRVLGCHMVGEHAAEIIQGLAIALSLGATKEQFDAVVGVHPTAAEEFVTMK